MTNFEWLIAEHKDLVIDSLIGKIHLGLKDGQPIDCGEIKCSECDFRCGSGCALKMEYWLLAEHNPYTIPIDTPVDTKVVVSNDGEVWNNRYFKCFQEDPERPYMCFCSGATSWSTLAGTGWKYCRLAEIDGKEQENESIF